MAISFTYEAKGFRMREKARFLRGLQRLIRSHRKKAGEISYIFTSDKELLALNRRYLKHNTLTDIITFEYSAGHELMAEIYISVPRVRENAKRYQSGFRNEMHRVMVHGVLHLLGYKDKKPSEKKKMREAEERFLKGLLQKK